MATVIVHPTKTNTIYVGGKNGLYVSEDNGEIGKKQIVLILDIFDIDFMPDNPDIMFICIRSKTSAEGKGIYRSKDGGKNWKQVYNNIGTEARIAIIPKRVHTDIFGK